VTLRDADAAGVLLAEAGAILRRSPDIGVLADRARALAAEVAAMRSLRPGGRSLLTAAELRLLPLLATHLSFREIGERLCVSRNTIKTQAVSVYRKLGVSSRSDAIAEAARLGLLPADFPPTG
jgi:LuxR family maltose regulon positive regulatory protein